ncbi:MAG: zf-HC2 domain-containing protein [Dehalobacterium sp.]
MHCSQIEDLLSSYIDHELLPEEILFVEKHLEYCHSCRQILADIQKTSNLLQSLPNVPMPDGFQEQLHELLAGVKQDTYISTKGRFGQNWLQCIFNSYRMVSAALILIVCFAAYSLTTFYRNMSYTEQMPALMNAEVAVSEDDNAESKSREKVMQSEQDVNLNSVTEENEKRPKSDQSKGHIFSIVAILIALPLLILINIPKFRRK